MVDLNSTIYLLNREQEEQHAIDYAKALLLPYINLTNYPLVKEILDIIPEEEAILHKVIPYLKLSKEVRVGVVDPNDPRTKSYLEELGQKTNLNFVPTLISSSSFYYGVSVYESIKKKVAEDQTKQIEQRDEFAEMKVSDIQSLADLAKKATITKLLDVLLVGAININASDIHIEPRESDFLVRYRVDGVLQDVVILPLAQYKQIVSRIKFQSKLRMDLVDQPQDGRFSYIGPGGVEIDFRVSLMPSAFGESAVLRLLGQEKSVLKLESLGFRSDALAMIRKAISMPHGMVVTSGPTGSGKSSTLYAVLSELKRPGVKIITLEDPVEYKIEGIEQSQVKPGAGYEFADGLRASLRQDPDVLMVGEIRDQETAEIAVQAALTGHLLLSTIHANSAPAVYARFLEIGVKPFLLSGSINLIMAQRLVRKICPNCVLEYSPKPELWQQVQKILMPLKDKLPVELQEKLSSPAPTLISSSGCDKCNKTGFLGREVIIEMLEPNGQIEELISRKASISEFERVASELGMITMEQDGLLKAISGTTTIEEVWRVTRG